MTGLLEKAGLSVAMLVRESTGEFSKFEEPVPYEGTGRSVRSARAQAITVPDVRLQSSSNGALMQGAPQHESFAL